MEYTRGIEKEKEKDRESECVWRMDKEYERSLKKSETSIILYR